MSLHEAARQSHGRLFILMNTDQCQSTGQALSDEDLDGCVPYPQEEYIRINGKCVTRKNFRSNQGYRGQASEQRPPRDYK